MNIRAVAILVAVVLAPLALAAPAWAKPRIALSIGQFKEVVERKDGAQTPRMVATQSATPGDVVEYVLTYANEGDEAAKGAVIDDPIPAGTTYIANSAAGEGAQVTFSADGGKTFEQAVKVTYEVKLPSGAVEKRVATPAEYTHVRWTIEQVPAGATGKVAFRVKVN